MRQARLSDLETLVQNRRRMWEDIEAAAPPKVRLLDRGDAIFRAWARPRIKNGTLVGFLAEDRDGRLLGGGAVWLQPSHPRPWWDGEVVPYLMSMYTRPEARGKGVASSVVRAALAWAKAEGYPRLVLHASEMGRGVYARLGFERTWEMRYPFHDRRLGSGRSGPKRGARRTTRGWSRRGARRAAREGSFSFR